MYYENPASSIQKTEIDRASSFEDRLNRAEELWRYASDHYDACIAALRELQALEMFDDTFWENLDGEERHVPLGFWGRANILEERMGYIPRKLANAGPGDAR